MARSELWELAHRLVLDHEGVLPAGTVLRCVARCRDELVLTGVRDGLPDAVAAMAAVRLRQQAAPTAPREPALSG